MGYSAALHTRYPVLYVAISGNTTPKCSTTHNLKIVQKNFARLQPANRPLPKVSEGDTVIARHKNGRYYRSQVTGWRAQTFYHVDFDDGSFSEDLYPEDVLVSSR